MQAQPDSALYLLQSLDDQQIPRGALQARYALLYTQALDKNYLPIPGDSLIKIAVNYYNRVKDDQRLGWAYLYLGNAYVQMGSIELAINTYKKAQEIANRFIDYALLSVVTSEMGALYQEQRHYAQALELYKISLTACRSSGNQRNEGYVLGRIGNVFYLSVSVDSAEYYYNRAREIAIDRNDLEFLYMLSVSHASVLQARKEYGEAQRLLLATIQEYRQGVIPIECYPLLSILYLHVQQIDSARHYMQLVLQTPQATTKQRAGAWEFLHKIEEEAGNYQTALHYATQHKTLSDSIRQAYYEKDLRVIEGKYQQEKFKNDNYRQSVRHAVIIFVIIALSIAVVFVMRLWWKRFMTRREQDIRRSFCVNHWNTAVFLKEFNHNIYYASKRDFYTKAIKAANIAYPGMIDWLKKDYSHLTQGDLALACLLCAGLRAKDFCLLYNTSDLNPVYTRCSRLYKKMGIQVDRNDSLSFRNKMVDLYIQD